MNKILKTLVDIGELIAFKHSIFALPFIFVSMIVASLQINQSVWFGFRLLVLGILCAVSARNFAMGVNRYLDMDIDSLNPRTSSRPSVDGRVSPRSLFTFIVVNAIVFIVVAGFINSLALKLSPFFLVILGGYSYFKRFSSLAHIVLGISLGLAPIAGAIAVLGFIPLWSVLLAMGVMFWVAGFDLLYALQDIDFDKSQGLFSIPSKYGWEASMALSVFFHALSIVMWLLFAWSGDIGGIGIFGIFICGFILFLEHKIIRQDFNNVNRAFFTLNGYLGIVFFVFILWDLL